EVGTLLLGGHTAKVFVPYWASAAKEESKPDVHFAKRITSLPKIAFSHTINEGELEDTRIVSGDLATEIQRIKNEPGKDILVYGGAGFVSDLIKNKLIDEFHFVVYPIALGKGTPIFQQIQQKQELTRSDIHPFNNGALVVCYKPVL
ncbi:MAG: dihydrofolate reductase family protein, partial [Sediminibacterium sp.]